jgi:hypothetical protein
VILSQNQHLEILEKLLKSVDNLEKFYNYQVTKNLWWDKVYRKLNQQQLFFNKSLEVLNHNVVEEKNSCNNLEDFKNTIILFELNNKKGFR